MRTVSGPLNSGRNDSEKKRSGESKVEHGMSGHFFAGKS